MKKYRYDLDVIKGLSILAVIFFHLGLLKSGYLGVDAFFVINGFFIIPSIVKKIASNNFSIKDYLLKRALRLLPLILMASIISLILGYWLMLPDDYENLSQSVIASSFFSNNILSAITTSDYWNTANDYKPLMHLWYVGVLFEFYIILPIILLPTKWISTKLHKDGFNAMVLLLCLFFAVSLVLFIAYPTSDGHRFYFPQYRFFELAIGGICGLYISKVKRNIESLSYVSLFCLCCCLLCALYYPLSGNIAITDTVVGIDPSGFTGVPLPPKVALLLTVFCTCCLVISNGDENILYKSRPLRYLGKASFSFYIWHQVVLAFYRYSFSSDVTIYTTSIVLIISTIASLLSYYFVERKIKENKLVYVSTAFLLIFTVAISFNIYRKSGVVRSVPELNIDSKVQRGGLFAEYCDRIFEYQPDFKDSEDRIKVLVVGNSYARDMANILLESSMKDSIAISYIYEWREELDLVEERSKKADVIFIFTAIERLPEFLKDETGKPKHNVYGIGTKNFGYCNGIVYKNRMADDYLKMTVKLRKGYLETNRIWQHEWGDHYINLLSLALDDNENVRVFTPEGKFISQDCLHLTESGAKWYASILNIKKYFNNEN